MIENLFITQNSYYFVYKHFIDIFEFKNNELILITENKRGIFKKYMEIIKVFGLINFLKCIFFEVFYFTIFFKRRNILKTFIVRDKDLNNFLKKKVLENKYKRIISIGCPCFIDPKIDNYDSEIFNVHGGIIPYQRGRYSPLKSIAKGHKYLGSTIHTIDDNFDSGKIISQDYFKLDIKNKLYNYNNVLKLSAELLKDFLLKKYRSIPDDVINHFRK